MEMEELITKKEMELMDYLSDTYHWAKENNMTFKDVVEEISTAGFSNEELGIMMKEIVSNDTFNIK